MFRTKQISCLAALAVLALTGCSDDGSPTGPETRHEEPVQNLRTTIVVTHIDVIKDGDGIEGRGEFYFYREAGGTGIGWWATLSTGDRHTVNWTKTLLLRGYEGEGNPFSITFKATEYDQNIQGETYADSDMDGRSRTAYYVSSPDLQETNYITLGNDQCKVRMHYRITSRLEDVETD